MSLKRKPPLRRYLFAFLDEYNDAEVWLDQWALHLSASLDAASSHQIELLLSQGKTLISQATAQAREMVQEQAMAPIIDIVTIDESGAVQESLEYLSMIDFAVDGYANMSATRAYPNNPVLQNWAINGYMLAWREYFLKDKGSGDSTEVGW